MATKFPGARYTDDEALEFHARGKPGKLEINPTIIFPIIDRVLGGAGNPLAKERELTIDDQGRILSYIIPDCPHMLKSPTLRRNIESSLLFTQFTPATTFGQPMPGKIRLSFRNSSINVKG